MIHVTPNGKYHSGFTIEGHAGYAERGHDIICASVSVLSHAVTDEVIRSGAGEASYNDDRIKCSVYTAGCERIIDMMIRTFEEIERQYPDNITVHKEEV